MDGKGKTLLVISAGLNFAIAILHLAMILVGGPAYLYYGAADLAVMAEAGSIIPGLVTFMLALIFIGFGLYALSGAGIIRPLPLVRLGLVCMGGIYTLRGLIVVLDVLRLVNGAGYPFRQTVFSAIALAIGLMVLIGTAKQWGYLRNPASR